MAKENLIFTDSDKLRRAEDIFLLVTGKRPKDTNMSPEHKEHMLARFTEFFEEAKIDLKKASKDEVVLFIYKKLGGGVHTVAQEERIKTRMKRFNIAKSQEKLEAEGPEDAEDTKPEDESDDE